MGRGIPESDGDTLAAVSLVLPPDEATRILKQYYRTYCKKNSKKDMAWARVVFCFGLVHTKEAQDHLLTLWKDYDRQLASGRVTVSYSLGGSDLNILAPIADGLRFYMDDPNIQSWIYERAAEIAGIPRSPAPNLNGSCRRTARGQLVFHLYNWLIIESASPTRDLSRWITRGFLFTLPKDIDYAKSAAAVVEIASRLKDWHSDMSEREWMETRNQKTDSCLDTVAYRLGPPLGIAIWEQYLASHVELSNVRKGSEMRLWWIALRCYSDVVREKKKEELRLDTKGDQLLSDACAYYEKLPDGYWTLSCIEGLYAISCCFPDSDQSPSLRAIRDLAHRRLSEQARESALRHALRVQQSVPKQ